MQDLTPLLLLLLGMPTYTYKAKKGPQEIVEGEIEAANRDQAIRRISEMGFFPTSVEEMAPPKRAGGSAAGPALKAEEGARIPRRGGAPSVSRTAKIPPKELFIFTRQLATLFHAQVPILRALALISESSADARMRTLVGEISAEVKEGRSLSGALDRFPEAFPQFYRAMVRSGEISGQLDAILSRLADFQQKDHEFRTRVGGALAYPIFLSVVGVSTILVLLTFVLPRLMVVFRQMNTQLPLPTRILMQISGFFAKGWPWMAAAATGVSFIATPEGVRARARNLLHRLRLATPVIRPLTLSADMERFSRTLALLLRSGLPAVQAVESTVLTLDNEILRAQLKPLGMEMLHGVPLSSALKKAPFFPALVRGMVLVGEEGGRLEEVLEEIADWYALEADQAMKVVASLVEPALILTMGLVVGGIVAAMLLPIFQLNMGVS